MFVYWVMMPPSSSGVVVLYVDYAFFALKQLFYVGRGKRMYHSQLCRKPSEALFFSRLSESDYSAFANPN